MGELERVFFANSEGAALEILEGAAFLEDIDNSPGGGAAGGESAKGDVGGVLSNGAVDGRGVLTGAVDDVVANEAAVSVDAHMSAHYGDPAGEWRALEEGRGFTVVELDVVVVRGADRRRWLHSLLG